MTKGKRTKAPVRAGKHKPAKAPETVGDQKEGEDLRWAFEQFLRRVRIKPSQGPRFSRKDLFDR